MTENQNNQNNIDNPGKTENIEKPKYFDKFKGSVFGTAVILGMIAAITVFSIALMNYFTAPVIEQRLASEKEEAIERLFGGGAKAETITGFEDLYKNFAAEVTEVLRIFDKDGREAGYCATVTPNGYAGKIVMLVAVNLDITVKNTLILSMSETAGYGTRLDSESDIWFREQFESKTKDITYIRTAPSPDENAVQIIIGATASSKAFIRGVNSALDVITEISEKVTPKETGTEDDTQPTEIQTEEEKIVTPDTDDSEDTDDDDDDNDDDDESENGADETEEENNGG